MPTILLLARINIVFKGESKMPEIVPSLMTVPCGAGLEGLPYPLNVVCDKKGALKTMMIAKVKAAATATAVAVCVLGTAIVGVSKAVAAGPVETAAERPDFHWRGIGPGLAVVYGISPALQMHPTNPNIIIGGADMGTSVRTTDGGKTWKIIGESGHLPPAQPGRPLHRVVFDFKRPEIVWMATGKGLYKSTDTGETGR